METTLISPTALASRLPATSLVIVDCRFDLADTAAGEHHYLNGHIPGAVYAHLDNDLSGPPLTDAGRHPLPAPAALIALFRRLGIDNGTQVVVYDGGNGMIASRLWWMLRYMGHSAVALLDGGWQAWTAGGHPQRSGRESNPPGRFSGAPRRDRLVLLDEVAQAARLIDSRGPERYRGETEPLDPRAGHIPGAVNFPFTHNVAADGRLLPAATLRAQLLEAVGQTPAEDAVFYCGSGVTACLNILSMVHAGLPEPRLYVGSWSEWSADPQRPAAVGPAAADG